MAKSHDSNLDLALYWWPRSRTRIQVSWKKIFGERGVAREKEEIAIEALLVLLDEAIEEVRIAAAEAGGKGLTFVSHEPGEEYRGPRNR